MNKYTIRATNMQIGRIRFYGTNSIRSLLLKIKELKSLGYIVEVK